MNKSAESTREGIIDDSYKKPLLALNEAEKLKMPLSYDIYKNSEN